MAISRVTAQDTVGTTSGATTVSATYPNPTTAGNLLIATVWAGSSNIPTINNFTGTTVGMNGSTASLGLFTKIASGSETTITASLTTTNAGRIHIYEYTGNKNPIDFDVAATTAGNSTTGVLTFDTATINTADASDLIFAVLGVNGDATSPAWTVGLNMRQQDASAIRMWDGDLIPGTTQSSFKGTSTWTNTLKPSSIIMAVRAASTTRTVMGIGSMTGVSNIII